MAGTMSRGELLSLVRHIGVTEQRIAAQLRHIEGQLQKLTSMKALDHPYYITFKWVQNIEELAAPRRSVGSALREDLSKLKKQIVDLRATSKKLRLANPWLDTLPRKRQGTRMSMNLRRQIKATVKKLEARGTIDEEAIGKLVDKVEENLRRFIIILDKDPSEENARNVLREMEVPLIFRGDFHLSSSEEAFGSLSNAGAKWVEQAKDRFSKTPTVDNLKFLLDKVAKAALLGTNDEALEISGVLEQNAEKAMKNAEDIFRHKPTVENYESMEQIERFCLQLGKQPLAYPPAGMPPVPPGTAYVVNPGDTLSGISKKYFGSPGYWDVIYRKNRDLIKNPDAPTAGTRLVIS